MSEMEYEPAPRVHVPLVRDWFGDAFDKWTTAFFRNALNVSFGKFVLIIVFFPLFVIYLLGVLGIYFFGLVAMLLAELVWVVAELITYRHRYRRAVLATYGPYMKELHGEI